MLKGKNQQNENKGKDEKVKEFKCFYSHKKGHYRKHCPERKKDNKAENKAGEAALVDQEYDNVELLIVSDTKTSSARVLDCGCICHMTPNRDLLGSF